MSRNDREKNYKNEEEVLARVAVVVAGSSIVFLPLLALLSNGKFENVNFENLSKFGDYVGGLTSSFLTLSSVLLIYAAFRTQQKELGATRKQLTETVKQAEISNETLLKQQFETTFFNMINMHSNLVDNLSLYNEELKGKDVFHSLYSKIDYYYRNEVFKDFIKKLVSENMDDDDFLENYRRCIEFANAELNRCYKNYDLGKLNKVFENLYETTIEGVDELGRGIEASNDFQLTYEDLLLMLPEREVGLLFENFIVNKFESDYLINSMYKNWSYKNVMEDSKFALNTYFKSVYNIQYFINKAKLTQTDKDEYLMIFTAIFNPTEIALLEYESKFGDTFDFTELSKITMLHIGKKLTTIL